MKMNLPYRPGEQVKVTSAYGYRTDPISGEVSTWHGGIDLAGQGSKLLCAPIGGTVLVSQIVTDKSNRTWEWGNYVCISGEDGNLYYLCHMASRAVSAGQPVKQGDVIGTEGSTGYSTGSHCHFEVRDPDGRQLDPTPLLGIMNEADTVWTVPSAASKPDGNIPNKWAEEAVGWARENGILFGHGNGDLKLHDSATREDMIVFLHRTYKLIDENKEAGTE